MQIGLIAGMGDLPVIIAADARARGYKVITIAMEHLASEELDQNSDVIKWLNPGKVGEMLDTLKKNGVTELIMAGKVPKSLLYKAKIMPDLRAIKMLFSLKGKNDDAILNAITAELAAEGITVINTAEFSRHLLMAEGCITSRRPDSDEWKDIVYGWHIAKEIGRLDIGQTVVVKGGAVMAVEAIEGTDRAIKRGGEWADAGAVVVKISKPQQDMRLDVPAIGMDTIQSMKEARIRVLAIEAQKSIIIKKESVIEEANRLNISIVGVTPEMIEKLEAGS